MRVYMYIYIYIHTYTYILYTPHIRVGTLNINSFEC